jgi:hypothetical protein
MTFVIPRHAIHPQIRQQIFSFRSAGAPGQQNIGQRGMVFVAYIGQTRYIAPRAFLRQQPFVIQLVRRGMHRLMLAEVI